jgi:hypothetical protein
MSPIFRSLLVIAMLLGVSFWYFKKQPQVNVADGKGWDGVTYHAMYLHYKGVASKEVYDAPFNKRIGLPWLASRLPLDATSAFRFINLASGLAACLLLYFALSQKVRGVAAFVCTLPMVFYIFSPLRFANFYPFTVDPPAVMFYALAALLITRKHFVSAGAALVLSAFFRESGTYMALALAGALALNDKTRRPTAVLICLIVAAGAMATVMLQLPGTEYSQFRTVMSSFKHKVLEPLELLRVIACIAMTLAPFLICRARRVGGAPDEADEQDVVGRWFLMLCLAMAIFGGSDTTRIFFIGYPLFALFLAGWVDRADGLTVALAAAAGMIANRFREMIPQPVGTWPNHDVSGLFAITPDYSHIGVTAGFAFYWAASWFFICGSGRSMLDRALRPDTWRKIAEHR